MRFLVSVLRLSLDDLQYGITGSPEKKFPSSALTVANRQIFIVMNDNRLSKKKSSKYDENVEEKNKLIIIYCIIFA